MNDFEKDFLIERNENVGVNNDSPKEQKAEKKLYSVTRKGIALVTALCITLSGIAGFSGAYIANSLTDNGGSGASSTETNPRSDNYSTMNYNLAAATGSELTVQEIIALAANSVVEIRTEKAATDGWMRQYITSGAGSGVIMSSDGYILTNNHVIDGTSKITVTLKNEKSYDAKLVSTDSQTDIAVLKIDAGQLTPAVYGSSDDLQVGDLTVAIGNPLGELGGSATTGIISALDRQLTIDGKTMSLLQTDASINPGNSGGGLFNQRGELIGLVVAKSSGSDVEGLGFAIPINTVKTVSTQLMDYGYVKGRPAMGLNLLDLTSTQNALAYGVRNLGIYVAGVEGSNAKKADFQEGDMLYYLDDQRISSYEDVTAVLGSHKVGDTIKVSVVRNEQIIKLTLTLAEKKTS